MQIKKGAQDRTVTGARDCRLRGVHGRVGGYLKRDLFFAEEAAGGDGEREREKVEEPRRNVINWLHDKTVLVPVRCPSAGPPLASS